MAGYRPAAMVRTPWGEASALRQRKLVPGLRLPPADVARNQRERLFGALVAAVAEKGYEATRIEDLVEISGVSRKAFYEHFSDKQDCFVSALEELITAGVALVRDHYDGEGAWDAGVRSALDAFLKLLASQPAAARLCFVDSYAAGPAASAQVERAFDEFSEVVRIALEGMPERAGMPLELVRAIVGGLRKVIHTRVHSGAANTLPELADPLWSWEFSYYPPPQPLRRPRASRAGSAPKPPQPRGDRAERILRALAAVAAERGYTETTVSEIAARASISLSTFYSYFENKEEAVLAALDSGSAQMMAAMLPAYRRAADWPHAVRAAIGAMAAFGAAEPDYARLGAVEVFAAGKRALEQRDGVLEGLQALIAQGYELAPQASPIAAEAIAGAVYALVHDQVRRQGPRQLPEIAPLATYVVLCPFVGPDVACEIANGDGRRRS